MIQLVAAIVLALIPAGAVLGDVLVLHDGRIFVGEATKQRRDEIVFRTRVDGIWVDLTFETTQVKDLYADPGNQADGESTRPVPARARPEPAAPRATGPVVAVVPLHGQVGGLRSGSVRGTFDAYVLEHCLDEAKAAGADLVILDVQSPGGFLLEMESLCELILERSKEQRIVAWPGEALSAAAVITLSCREMVVRPDSTIGAAVIVQEKEEGLSAVEAKLASPHHAKQREYMAQSGRPKEVLAAMTVQTTSLWWSPQDGFTDDRNVASSGGYELVDGAETVLTMLARDARRWGLAAAEANTAKDVATALGIENAAIVDLSEDVRQINNQLDRRVGNVLRQFRDYFLALSDLHGLLGELQSVIDAADDAAIKDLRRQARLDLREARTSAQLIKHQDRDLIARRAQLPEAVLAQFETDAEAFEEMNRLLRRSRGDGASQAQRLTAAVLEAWRRLLS